MQARVWQVTQYAVMRMDIRLASSPSLSGVRLQGGRFITKLGLGG